MDLILTNGRLLTMTGEEGWATALAISSGRIAAVGSDEEIAPLAGRGRRRIDLRGKAVLPGFHDCHCHMLAVGVALSQIDLSPERAGTIPALLQLLRDEAPKGCGWICGRGYDQNRLAALRHPARSDLDSVSVDRPVVATHASGHALVANSHALRLAGIGRDTPDPAGGTIERDPRSQEPTGLLLENAMALVHNAMPPVSRAEQVTALGLASRRMASVGITSASEAWTTPDDLPAFFDAAEKGKLSIRCHPFLLAHRLKNGDRFLTPADFSDRQNEKVTLGIAKIFADGAIGTRTAYLRLPYADYPDRCGTPIWERRELGRLIQGAHDAGWQVAAHAIGDAAIDLCLDAFQKAMFHSPALVARHRIEHAMLLWDEQIGRMATQGIVPVFQPEFIARFGDVYMEALGERRAVRIMPLRSIVQAGGRPLALSSDQPVVPGNPLDGVRAAVERKTPAGRTLGVGERLTPYEALSGYTSGAAFAARCEGERGRLAEGLLADLVILSEDPTTVPIEEWSERIRVELTAVAGKPVFGSWAKIAG